MSISIASVHTHGASHRGLTCEINEDRSLIHTDPDGALILAVADGLGGNVSSRLAAQIVVESLQHTGPFPDGREAASLEKMVQTADKTICSRVESDPGLEGMATTLVCGILKESGLLHWINVGDSRLYLFRQDRLLQVTTDQTLAKLLVDEGEISPEQAKTHYSKNILDQCIGYGACEPQCGVLEVRKGDLLLFATDGLYKMIPDRMITSILKRTAAVSQTAQDLIESALEFGGRDNVTVVLAKV